jgi:ubiquitin C-terminal hydrolase
MNSGIQCLSNLRSVQRYFRKYLDLNEVKINDIPETPLIIALADLLKLMWKGEMSQIAPMEFYNEFKDLLNFFKGSAQHDSQEFLRMLLDRLHDALKTQSNSGKSFSIVSDTFKSDIQCKIVCTNCGDCSIKEEEYYDFSVSIPTSEEIQSYKKYSNEMLNLKDRVTYRSEKHTMWSKIQQVFIENKDVTSLYDCLLNFCLPEDLKEQFTCKSCNDKGLSRREIKILRPPNVLMLVIKRFKYSTVGSKISTYVQFPLKLDIRFFLNRNTSCPYQLTGLIQHIGGVSGGHYISYCKNYKNNNWYEFDDSRTRQITEQQVLEKEAYILFYQRQIPDIREKFRSAQINTLLPSYWCNLYYTVSEPGPMYLSHLLCSHQNLKPNYSLSQFTLVSTQQAADLRNTFNCDGPQLKVINECQKCIIQFSFLSNRVELELKVFDQLNSISPFEGPWYLVNCDWICFWKRFCSHDEIGRIPGPVDNNSLFDNGSLKQGLVAGKHYRAVNRHVWAAFMFLYRGGPEIRRLQVEIYAQPAPQIHCSTPDLTDEQIGELKSIQSAFDNY